MEAVEDFALAPAGRAYLDQINFIVYADTNTMVLALQSGDIDLTVKEIEVLRLVCEGLEYSEIAEALGIAESTVKYHVSNILSKTGYANKTRLAIAVTAKKFIIPNLPEDFDSGTAE